MYPLFAIALIINICLVAFIIDIPDGIGGAIQRSIESGSRGSVPYIAFLVLGPLFGVYVAVVSAKQAIEADDDFFHFKEEADTFVSPTAKQRRRMIFALSVSTGFALLPFTFWCYTASFDMLWDDARPFYAQPGIAASVGLVFALYFIAPKLFPSAARRLSKIEDAVTRGFEGLDRD